MRESLRRGRDELAARVQQALTLSTKKEAEHIVNTVISCIEHTLLNNLGTNGFTMKMNSFGKFSVRHGPGMLRKIPFTGETRLTKPKRKIRFISLGMLRQLEPVDDTRQDHADRLCLSNEGEASKLRPRVMASSGRADETRKSRIRRPRSVSR